MCVFPWNRLGDSISIVTRAVSNASNTSSGGKVDDVYNKSKWSTASEAPSEASSSAASETSSAPSRAPSDESTSEAPSETPTARVSRAGMPTDMSFAVLYPINSSTARVKIHHSKKDVDRESSV